jgi:hypothetical protein
MLGVRITAVIFFVIGISGCDKFQSFLAAESWKWSASRIVETKHRGDVICHAIDAYRKKTGKYPAQLTDLQPEFLQQIPQPTVGYKKWHYDLIDSGSDYWLQVVASEFGPQLDKTSRENWSYMNDTGGWR